MFHVIVVVGPVRLVACSCGSCNREDRGVGVGRGVASRPPMSLNCVRGLNHKYPQRLHLLHQGDPLSGPIGADIRLELHPYDH